VAGSTVVEARQSWRAGTATSANGKRVDARREALQLRSREKL
jgi:hypothetical protein